ncbi:MAG: phage/plasmid primase, P4 family [Methanoregula sp.]|uniref:DNA primase family protein n=1 Tax=Methanoregula sp. TaxID=2052170 RepID=UPI003C78EEF4
MDNLDRDCGAAFANPSRFAEALALKKIMADREQATESPKAIETKPVEQPVSISPEPEPVPDKEPLRHLDPISRRMILASREEGRQSGKNLVCRDHPRTDLGNSQRFVLRFGLDCRYCHAFKNWYIWDGIRWQRDNDGLVRELAKDAVYRIYDEASVSPGATEQGELYKWGISSQGRPRIDAMVSLSTSALAISPDELDTNPDRLNFPNGTLDLQTFEFAPARRDDLITRVTGCAYDPAAACPSWGKFLDKIMAGNQNLIGFIQRAVGYSLTGHTGERAIFLCHGGGANGKSTLLNTIMAVIGEYGLPVESNTFCVSRNESIRNDLAALKGARFVTATEAGKGKRLDESIIKQFTGGGDKIRARFLYQEFFEFKPECKIWWAFNSAPRITDSTDSIWARVKMIPFSVIIPEAERDIRLPDKLLKEAPGIINWAIAGLQEYQRIGLAEPVEVRSATQQYREDQDNFADFLTDMCICDDPRATCGATDLYNVYVKWCSTEAPDEKVKSPRSFGFEMNDHGFKRDRDGATKRKIYLGIRPKNGGF